MQNRHHLFEHLLTIHPIIQIELGKKESLLKPQLMNCKCYIRARDDFGTETEHSLSDSDICIKEALIDLQNTMNEVEIRQKINDVCRSKLPTIRKEDFDLWKEPKIKSPSPLLREIFDMIIPKLKNLWVKGKFILDRY